MTNHKLEYTADVTYRSVPGSNKAGSYLKALEYLGPILRASGTEFRGIGDVFGVDDPRVLRRVYEFVLEQQKLVDGGIFKGATRQSYWRNGFYSAAVKDYLGFVVQQRCSERCWELYRSAKGGAGEGCPVLVYIDTHLTKKGGFHERPYSV